MSPECHIDIFINFTPEYPWLLFWQCKYLHFLLDTISLSIDCVFCINLRPISQSQSELLRMHSKNSCRYRSLLDPPGVNIYCRIDICKVFWLARLESAYSLNERVKKIWGNILAVLWKLTVWFTKPPDCLLPYRTVNGDHSCQWLPLTANGTFFSGMVEQWNSTRQSQEAMKLVALWIAL